MTVPTESGQNINKQNCTHEDEDSADPVSGSEWVVEVVDGEHQADELTQGHHQGHGQGRTFRGQDKHTADTHKSDSGQGKL